MGYVETAHASPDQEIYVVVRDKHLRAKVVRLPFS
jgi:glycine cleavage system aminomethyltransferase T